MRLLPILERAFELHWEAGHFVETEQDAEDFVARTGNTGERVIIVAGPTALYAKCSQGRTEDLPIYEGEGPEIVRALGAVAKAILLQAIRRKMTSA